MNREIKFRAIHEGSNKMVYGNLIKGTFEGKPFTQIEHYDSDDFYQWHVKTETVGQFTGLKDRNGINIYEGDVLEYESGYSYYVTFEHGEYICYHTSKSKSKGKWGNLSYMYHKNMEITVIGNIHSNPELL